MFDQCLYFNATALARRIEKEWAEVFAPFGLTPAQGFMLRAVLAKPGLTPGELAKTLVISRPTATRALAGLVERGLIAKQGREEDGRELSLMPTPDAQALAADINAAAAAMTRKHKDALGEDTFTEVVTLIRSLRGALD